MKLLSYLFDEDHPELRELTFFGPACTGRVVRAIEDRVRLPVQILRGAIVAHTMAYRTSEISLGARSPGKASGLASTADTFSRVADMKIQSVLTGELFEGLLSTGTFKNESRLFEALSKCTVWVASAFPIDEDIGLEVHNEIADFDPYLGYAIIDLNNPFLYNVFVEFMFHNDVIIDGSGIYIPAEEHMPKEDQEDAVQTARMYGSKFDVAAISVEDFETLLPNLEQPKEISERGELSVERISSVTKPTQRETLAQKLAEQFGNGERSKPLRFVATPPKGVPPVDIAQAKLTEYLLNFDHPKGGGKAKFFSEVLGINPEDWEYLRDQILRGWEIATLYRVGRNEWEYTHGALMKISGRNGRSAVLETGWRVAEHGPVQFVTAYPAAEVADAPAPTPSVVNRTLAGDARWSAIYELAIDAAKQAHDQITPTPMFLVGYPPEWEGKCGSATVTLSEDSAAFTRWLVDNGHAFRRRDSAVLSFHSPTQSIERSTAAAEAFASVLGVNGILCRVESRLD